MAKGPHAEIIAQVEIAVPGYTAVSGQIGQVPGEIIELDDVAIQLHQLVNDIVMTIRKRGKVG